MLIEITLTLVISGLSFWIGRMNRAPQLKQVQNKDRKFGAARLYYITKMRDASGTAHRYAFTEGEIHTAAKRADGNAEDWE
jgi:hypothetical protein